MRLHHAKKMIKHVKCIPQMIELKHYLQLMEDWWWLNNPFAFKATNLSNSLNTSRRLLLHRVKCSWHRYNFFSTKTLVAFRRQLLWNLNLSRTWIFFQIGGKVRKGTAGPLPNGEIYKVSATICHISVTVLHNVCNGFIHISLQHICYYVCRCFTDM